MFVSITAVPVFANSVSVSCIPNTPQPAPIPGFPPPPGSYASCSGLGPDQAKASALGEAYLDVPATGGYNTLTLTAIASASNFEDIGSQEAHSTVNFAEYLQAIGPLRAGFLQVSPSGSGTMGVGIGYENISASMPSGSSFAPPVLTGSGSSSYDFPFTPYANPVPTTLGVPFLLSGEAIAAAYAGLFEAHSVGSAVVNYSFRFFEADSVTPVTVSEVPEPSLTLAMGLLLGGSALLRHKRDS